MPMNLADYPKDWTWITQQIRDQAGERCEWCGVENHALGARDLTGVWHYEDDIEGMKSDIGEAYFGEFPKSIKIVLTVAHLCHEKQCRDPTHLFALCQKCHLNHDRPRHIEKRKRNARIRYIEITGQKELFE